MPNLAQNNYLTALKTVEALNACGCLEELKQGVLETLHRILGCNTVSYNDIDLEAGTNEITFYPDDEELMVKASEFEALMSEHPVMTYMKRTGDGTAWKITDFITQKAFRELELYKKVYAATDTEYQMAIAFQPESRRLIGIACNRGSQSKDFDDSDRELLNLLRPHFVNIWGMVIKLDALKDGKSSHSGEGIVMKKALTTRERQVLDWISEGKTNTQIANRMGVSALTIKTHAQKILRKLGAKNRPEAVKMIYGSR